uniref:Nuclear receptor domain-containing protein n=1 Tax=Syphacia muris TaxID=451379 RepID=A0A0N5B0C2_9BILA
LVIVTIFHSASYNTISYPALLVYLFHLQSFKYSGYHYDAPSCNGCKTFFRRTVLKGRKYECKNAKRCSLSDGRRGLCRACRYDRCLVSGMNPLLIQVTSDDVVSMENISKCLNRKRVFTEDKPTSLVISNKVRQS